MADITMCSDMDCDKSQDCYRFAATANVWRQSYFIQSPRQGHLCPEFVQNKESWK